MNRSRWLLLLCIVSLLILEHARLCFSDVCSGIVVDGSNGSRGIPGVIVAAGYGLDRTVTDSSGRFSLDIAESGIQSRLIHQPFLNPTIKWNMRQRLLDLTVAPGIKSVSIYRPDGSCFWKKTLGRTNEKRLIATPPMAPGLYLVTFTRSDNSRFTWRTIQGAGGGSCIFTLPSYGTSTNSTADASTKSINLIFRHDRYFPLDRQIQTPATDL
ncbi:MAG TPA: hypothetical protein VHO70_18125, partial [Chitinispirillaceae bacterium]|nr:hypothetical protein [Chitinispirillaceae bacterium]